MSTQVSGTFGRGDAALGTLLIVGAAPSDGAGGDPAEGLAGRLVRAPDRRSAVGLLETTPVELVVVGQDVPPGEALALLRDARALCAEVPVAVVAAEATVAMAVRFIQAGAYDYFGGPLDRARLGRLVRGMLAERSRAREGRERFFCKDCPPEVPIVGRSEAMVRTLETVRLVAESRCNPLLVLGETGTGKELAARALHAWRCGDPESFVAVNCAALTANLLESELFGHVKGAFTGADRDKVGLFELAGSGSILLDEISEMPQELQAKLLRVLQERTFRKVGGTKDIACEATVIASSNRDLMKMTEQGRFRRDLYYRLAVFPITVPPLRSDARREDIPLLAEYFVATACSGPGVRPPRLARPAVQKLMQHTWPGNVRELRNVLERAAILAKSGDITASGLIIEPLQEAAGAERRGRKTPGDFSLETAEREFILRALRETGWQRTRAAALLGITRATLHAKIKRYDIAVPGRDGPPSGGARTKRRRRGART